MFVADSGSTSHVVNSLKNMTNLWEVKTVINTGNNKKLRARLEATVRDTRKEMVKFTR